VRSTSPESISQRTRGPMDSGLAPKGAPRNDGKAHAGTGAAARAAGTGRNVIMIRNAPSPMIHEPT
jgi:hypothetical protein